MVKYFLNSFTQIKLKSPKFTKAKEETKYWNHAVVWSVWERIIWSELNKSLAWASGPFQQLFNFHQSHGWGRKKKREKAFLCYRFCHESRPAAYPWHIAMMVVICVSLFQFCCRFLLYLVSSLLFISWHGSSLEMTSLSPDGIHLSLIIVTPLWWNHLCSFSFLSPHSSFLLFHIFFFGLCKSLGGGGVGRHVNVFQPFYR